ncbi:hypothetical protein LEMLEM_LOCUS2632, partial [Lemmus lemmus]
LTPSCLVLGNLTTASPPHSFQTSLPTVEVEVAARGGGGKRDGVLCGETCRRRSRMQSNLLVLFPPLSRSLSQV